MGRADIRTFLAWYAAWTILDRILNVAFAWGGVK